MKWHKSGRTVKANGESTVLLVNKTIDDQPTADVRENVRGEWIEDKKAERQHQLIFHKVWTCSQCGEQQCRPKGSNFCPNCGAQMMRGENHDRHGKTADIHFTCIES